MSILEDLTLHLRNFITIPIYQNFATEKANENCVILWHYDGTPNSLGRNAKVQITVKNIEMLEAEKMAVLIFDMLYPKGQFQKVIEINGKNMQIRPLQEPFYNEKDQANKHCYVFNVNIDYSRE